MYGKFNKEKKGSSQVHKMMLYYKKMKASGKAWPENQGFNMRAHSIMSLYEEITVPIFSEQGQ